MFRKLVGADARPEFHPWSEASWGHRHRASEEDRTAEGSYMGILSSSGPLRKLGKPRGKAWGIGAVQCGWLLLIVSGQQELQRKMG